MSAFLTEMWAWYALTIIAVVARIISRRMLYGSFKRMLSDDYLMVFAMFCFTGMLIVVHILTYTPTNLINPADGIVLTPEDIDLRVYGSKLVLVVEETQMFTIWSIKGCFLLMYSRLTISLKQNWMVKALTIYCIVTFIVMQILFFAAWCRPFHNYWQVPPDDLNCSAETNHMITNAVFNISSDIMIIIFPMPLFVQSQLALKRKLVLCGVFALGAFTILAAALSKYYSLGQPYGGDWIYWYIREVSTAIIAANLPMTWTLLQRLFRIGSFNGVYGKSSGPRTGGTGAGGVGGGAGGTTRGGAGGSRFRSAYGNLSSQGGRDHYEDERTLKKKSSTLHELDDISPADSLERVNSTGSSGGRSGKQRMPLEIYQQKDIEVVVSDAVVEVDRTPPGLKHSRSKSRSRSGNLARADGDAAGPGPAAGQYGVPYAASISSLDSLGEPKAPGAGDMGVVTRAYRGV
ncbi:uncharacterized protein B0I36DRAFT_331372 [Microdochium trichocladiopsis]|uniref:Rhodopsin domain-containing protein n=1 Tax=Microdochium trichocladiopsis TaxID=1682393 RepID=A0A9P8XX44_9PEZI|nr:uncharacterized protein B0I36DRAFT_331372 [Microdochium trichocladiopsis]KAH7024422.1 hypothetical protein B0I36DRAFT_331372 [Microdochium trichocladiopsis]